MKRLPVIVISTVVICAGLVLFVWHSTAPVIEYAPFPELTKAPAKSAPKPAATLAVKVAPAIQTSSTPDPRSIDPDIQRLADDLANKEQTPMRDLEIVNGFVALYSKVFQGNPIGDNEDITAVLTGHNLRNGILFPPNSPMIVKGQLVDRWGTPYWFHSSSSTQMEIRSAGPDKNLFTFDDVIINPGPESFSSVSESH